jgi:serine protease DegQ
MSSHTQAVNRIGIVVMLALALAAGLAAPALGQSAPAIVNGIPTLAPMLDRVTPAVVNISVVSETPAVSNPLYSDPYFRRFFDLPDVPLQERRLSAGSGVIVDAARGYVLTNHHVIADATEIAVTLKDGRRLHAKLVGSDPGTDIALLKVQADDLVAASFGDSDRLKVGDYVVAIGNPFGIGQTVTSGIVSALGRSGISDEGYEDFIQTDASINPGNSGGPLMTWDGKLVGINSAILSPAGGNVGIGFAVPSNIAAAVMNQLIEHGEVRRGWIGISIQDVTPDLAEALRLDTIRGAIIADIAPNSPAQRAGLRAGDVVIAVDRNPIHSAADLRNRIGLKPAGAELELTVVGRRGTRDVEVRTEAGGRAAANPLLVQ